MENCKSSSLTFIFKELLCLLSYDKTYTGLVTWAKCWTGSPFGIFTQSSKDCPLVEGLLAWYPVGPLHKPVTWYRINYAGINKAVRLLTAQSGWAGKSSFVLEVPPGYLHPSIIYSVPCHRIVQGAYWWKALWKVPKKVFSSRHQYPFPTALPGTQIKLMCKFSSNIPWMPLISLAHSGITNKTW